MTEEAGPDRGKAMEAVLWLVKRIYFFDLSSKARLGPKQLKNGFCFFS